MSGLGSLVARVVAYKCFVVRGSDLIGIFRHTHTRMEISREILMGVGNGVASVIMLTFTMMPARHADFYKDARPPC